MEILDNEILHLEPLEIYKRYKSELLDVFGEFGKIALTDEEFEKIALEEIQELQINYESKDYSNFKHELLTKIRERLLLEKEVDVNPSFNSFLLEIKKYRVLPQEEAYELIIKAQNGDKEAVDKLVKHNLKLVVRLAKGFINRGVPFEDLVQEGSFGLFEVIKRFDISKGLQFSTYASKWILASLYAAVYKKSNVIKISTNQHQNISKLKKAYNLLYDELKREPSIEEIAEELSWSYDKTLQVYFLSSGPVYLDKKVGVGTSEERPTVGDFIPSEDNVEDNMMNETLRADVEIALNESKLTPSEKKVIIYRFGLEDGHDRTLEEVGKMLNVTRERIRQKEAKSLGKLRDSEKGRILIHYIKNISEQEVPVPKKLPQIVNEDVKTVLPEEAYTYFSECHLSPIEMRVLALYFGVSESPKTYKEISLTFGISIQKAGAIQQEAASKLLPTPNRERFIEFMKKKNETTPSGKYVKKKKEPVLGLYYCKEEQVKRAASKLGIIEQGIITKKFNGEPLSMEETMRFNTTIQRRLTYQVQKVVEHDKELKEFLKIKKKVDPELFKKVLKIYDTEIFQELVRNLSYKEAIAILLLYGYIEDSNKPVDEVAALLDMKVEDVLKIHKRAKMISNYCIHLSYEDEKAKLKELINN